MGLGFYEEAIRLQHQYAPKSMHVQNTLQTNGTIIDKEWCSFFKENDFLVGLSLDGPKNLHNTFRHDSQGHGSFDQVIRAVVLLKEFGINFNVLCCVSRANVDYPLEVYHFLRDEVGAEFIQFIPILQRKIDKTGQETNLFTDCSVRGVSYGNFLRAVFDEWVHRDVGKVFVQIFDLALGVYAGQPSNLCVFAETCGRALVLEHNGDLYSCDYFVNPENFLGNIKKTPLVDLVDSEKQKVFGNKKLNNLSQKCLTCDVRFLCHGGCPKNRDEKGLNYLCEGYQSFFRYIDQPMKIMAGLLRQRRDPSEVMSIIKQG